MEAKVEHSLKHIAQVGALINISTSVLMYIYGIQPYIILLQWSKTNGHGTKSVILMRCV